MLLLLFLLFVLHFFFAYFQPVHFLHCNRFPPSFLSFVVSFRLLPFPPHPRPHPDLSFFFLSSLLFSFPFCSIFLFLSPLSLSFFLFLFIFPSFYQFTVRCAQCSTGPIFWVCAVQNSRRKQASQLFYKTSIIFGNFFFLFKRTNDLDVVLPVQFSLYGRYS